MVWKLIISFYSDFYLVNLAPFLSHCILKFISLYQLVSYYNSYDSNSFNMYSLNFYYLRALCYAAFCQAINRMPVCAGKEFIRLLAYQMCSFWRKFPLFWHLRKRGQQKWILPSNRNFVGLVFMRPGSAWRKTYTEIYCFSFYFLWAKKMFEQQNLIVCTTRMLKMCWFG